MKCIIGFYNEGGYKCCITNENGNVIDSLYEAGNNTLSSAISDSVTIGSVHCVPLETIKEYCIKTSKEIAEENKILYIGTQYEEIEKD